MEYVMAWRMEIAKGLLRDNVLSVSEVAERVDTARPAHSAWRSVVMSDNHRDTLREARERIMATRPVVSIHTGHVVTTRLP